MSNLTPEQRKHLRRLRSWPFRMWCPATRYNAIFDGYEAANARAAEQAVTDAEVTRQRSYYEILNRVTTYTGPDYRVRLVGQRTWIRATERQYEQAAQTGVQRSVGIPEPELLQIAA